MTSWLTTHYPHPIPDDLPWHAYLQRMHRDAVTGIGVDDRVFFNEFAGQKPVKDGRKYSRGLQGIVRVARVCGPIYHRAMVVEYVDGSTVYWSWGVPTDREEQSGFVDRSTLCRLLRYKPGYSLRGFQGGTGVKRLDDSDAAEILRAFKAGTRPNQQLK